MFWLQIILALVQCAPEEVAAIQAVVKAFHSLPEEHQTNVQSALGKLPAAKHAL